MGVALAVNGEALEGRTKTMSNGCALNRPQKLRFTPFYFISTLSPLLLLNCLTVVSLLCGIRVAQKANFYLMHL